MYTFDTHIPVPTGKVIKYPFSELQPGESVLYPTKNATAKRRAYKSAHMLCTRRDWDFAIRTLPEGVRVWRIS